MKKKFLRTGNMKPEVTSVSKHCLKCRVTLRPYDLYYWILEDLTTSSIHPGINIIKHFTDVIYECW
jgi:hypothetical protein